MNNHQPHESRRQAARKFASALDDLETVFKSAPSQASSSPSISNSSTSDSSDQPSSESSQPPMSRPSQPVDSTASGDDFNDLLDDAVQDIDVYMISDEESTDENG